jgi:diguanylate cyclase (GGDEF)-like protein
VAIAGITRGKGDRSLIVAGYALGVLRLAEGRPPRIWANAEGLIEHARQAVEPEPGRLWVAARFGVMESSGGEKLRYTLKLDSGFANGLFESPDGRWYAATSSKGVFVRDAAEWGEWRPVPVINSNLDALHVRAIAWTGDGDMWVQTLRGVSVFRGEHLVEKITHGSEPAFPESVNAVVEAENGDVWVGGVGGIAVRSGSEWRSLPMPNGPGPTIYSMAKAPDGAIWAGGANGVGRYADGRWTTWDSRSGLLDDECNSNGLFIDDDATVYVGTMGGLARFDPRVEPLVPPPLELRWTYAPPVGEDGKSTLDARDLQLRWSAAWLGPEPVEYRVRMPRLRDSWSEPTENGSLDIQNLGPGLHPVEVEARVAGVVPWTEPLRLDVSVHPAWHETLPARAAMVILLTLLGFGLVRLRVRQLRGHAAALEATVRDRTGELAEKVAQLEESERRGQAARDALEQMALVDGLTGIANRRRFDDALETEWRRSARGGRPLSLILFDVDHFKQFNDTLGHLRGDECLRAVAAVLSEECARAADVVARFGGEEFALILPDSTTAGAIEVAQSLLRRFEQLRIPGAASEPSAEVSLSGGGVTLVPAMDGDPVEILQLADRLLYQAKAAGRKRVLYRNLTEEDNAEPIVIQRERRHTTEATQSSA